MLESHMEKNKWYLTLVRWRHVGKSVLLLNDFFFLILRVPRWLSQLGGSSLGHDLRVLGSISALGSMLGMECA